MKQNVILKYLIIFSCVLILSCEQNSTQPYYKKYEKPTFENNQSEFTDSDLLQAAYSDYKYPDNFYSEDFGDTSLYYVNTFSIDSLSFLKRIELSTNNMDKALSWCKRSSPEGSTFFKGVENEKFIEYLRFYHLYNYSPKKLRVHNRSYFSRDNYNLMEPSDTIGTFEKENFSIEDTKELIDYLWYVKNIQGQRKILSSFSEDNIESFLIHHFELIKHQGDWGIPDMIVLYHNIYIVDKNNGLVILNEVEKRTLKVE